MLISYVLCQIISPSYGLVSESLSLASLGRGVCVCVRARACAVFTENVAGHGLRFEEPLTVLQLDTEVSARASTACCTGGQRCWGG